MYLDLNTRLYLLRRLFFRRASQNVVSRGPPARRPGPRDPVRPLRRRPDRTRLRPPLGAARRAPRRPASPSPSAPSGSCSGRSRSCSRSSARGWPGIDADWLSLVQLVPTLVLIVSAFLLVDVALSDVVPGANDNASGVATALSLAGELDRDPPEQPRRLGPADRRRVVPAGGNARRSSRAHRKQLSRDSTYFVCIDTVGRGRGPLRDRRRLGRQLPDGRRGWSRSARRSRTTDRDGEDRYGARALRNGLAGDSMPPGLAATRATTITCAGRARHRPGRPHAGATSPTASTPRRSSARTASRSTLVRLLDRDVGRAAGR